MSELTSDAATDAVVCNICFDALDTDMINITWMKCTMCSARLCFTCVGSVYLNDHDLNQYVTQRYYRTKNEILFQLKCPQHMDAFNSDQMAFRITKTVCEPRIIEPIHWTYTLAASIRWLLAILSTISCAIKAVEQLVKFTKFQYPILRLFYDWVFPPIDWSILQPMFDRMYDLIALIQDNVIYIVGTAYPWIMMVGSMYGLCQLGYLLICMFMTKRFKSLYYSSSNMDLGHYSTLITHIRKHMTYIVLSDGLVLCDTLITRYFGQSYILVIWFISWSILVCMVTAMVMFIGVTGRLSRDELKVIAAQPVDLFLFVIVARSLIHYCFEFSLADIDTLNQQFNFQKFATLVNPRQTNVLTLLWDSITYGDNPMSFSYIVDSVLI